MGLGKIGAHPKKKEIPIKKAVSLIFTVLTLTKNEKLIQFFNF